MRSLRKSIVLFYAPFLLIFHYYTTFFEFCKANYTLFLAFSLFAWYNMVMKAKNSENKTVIKIKFSKLVIGLCVLVYLLCLGGMAISIWRMLEFGVHGFSDVLKYPFLIAICAFGILLITAMLISSNYIVKNGNFITQYGFVRSKFAIKEITELTLNSDEKKLTVYFSEQYLIIAVHPSYNEKLIRAILDVNPDFKYEVTLTDKAE